MENLNSLFEELDAMMFYFSNEVKKFSIDVKANDETFKMIKNDQEAATVTIF